MSDEGLAHTVAELRRVIAQPTVLRAYVEKPNSKKKSAVKNKIDVDELLAGLDDADEEATNGD